VTEETPWVGGTENFTHTHVKGLLSEGLVSSAANLEKSIFALEYVAQIQDAGLDFVFKGGSAVQILLGDRWNRLSVDVDICVDASKEKLTETLDTINRRFGGKGFSYIARREEILGSVPFYSFRVTTPPITEKGRVILLDAMGLKPDYATLTVPLKSFYYYSSLNVTTPTIGAILGDKLSTIGPKTVGRIMRDSRNGLEYAKHFYDINALSHAEPNLKEFTHAYSESVGIQSKVRCRDFTIGECVEDAVFTCQVASLPQTPGEDAFERLELDERSRARFEHEILRKGLKNFQPFLVKGVSYAWDHLREYASRTALLTRMTNTHLPLEEVRDMLNQAPPSSKEEIQTLWNEIEALRLPAEKLWFIDPTEILNFPRVLQAWHHFYTLNAA